MKYLFYDGMVSNEHFWELTVMQVHLQMSTDTSTKCSENEV